MGSQRVRHNFYFHHTARNLGHRVQNPTSNTQRGTISKSHYWWVTWLVIDIPLMIYSVAFCSLLSSYWLVFSFQIDCRQHIGRTPLLFFHVSHLNEHYMPNTGRVTIMGERKDTIMNKTGTFLPSVGIWSNGIIILYDFLNFYYALSFVSILRCWK